MSSLSPRRVRRTTAALLAGVGMVAATGLAACADDTPASAPTTTVPVAVTTVVAPVTTVVAPVTTVLAPVTTTVAQTSLVVTTIVALTPSSDEQLDPKAATIDVLIGEDSGPDRVETVAKGAEIQLNITNPTADDEYHVHGYDLEFKGKKDAMATLNFTADKAGRFEVESHVTHTVLLIIEVK